MTYQATVATVTSRRSPEVAHYFSPEPEAPSRPRSVVVDIDGRPVPFTTDAGVFSPGRLDPGTRFLLDHGARPPAGPRRLADVGCGWGALAVALALRAPEAEVWAVDVSRRAQRLCRINAKAAGVADRVRVVGPDEVPADLVLDAFWSNPPIRVGKEALHELLLGWLGRLAPGGAAHLVVNRNLGADSLGRWLGEQGWAVERLRSRSGYRLLDVSQA